MTMPALPPGFEMDAPPALPPGFELDQAEPVEFKGGKAQIPGPVRGMNAPESTAVPVPELRGMSLSRKVLGGLEAALSVVTGLTGGSVGAAGGLVEGLAKIVQNGKFGTAAGANEVEATMAQRSGDLTYEPRTDAGQAIMQNYVAPVGAALAPLTGHGGEMGMLQSAASPAKAAGMRAGREAKAAVGNAGLDAAAGMVKVNPQKLANAGAAVDAGMDVPLHTIGDRGAVVKGAGEAMGQIPLSGSKHESNIKAFNKQVIAHINPEETSAQLTPQVMDRALKTAGKTIGDNMGAVKVPMESLSPAMNALRDGLSTATVDAEKVVRGYLGQLEVKASENGGVIPGAALRELDTKIGEQLRSSAGAHPDIESRIAELQDAIRDAAEGQMSPEQADATKAARQRYAKTMSLVPAYADIRKQGYLDPGKLMSLVGKSPLSKRLMATGNGGAWQDLAAAGELVQPEGSALRGRLIGGGAGIGAGGLYAATGSMTPVGAAAGAAGVLGTANLYNRVGPKIVKKLVERERKRGAPPPEAPPPELTTEPGAGGPGPAPRGGTVLPAPDDGPLGPAGPDLTTSPGAGGIQLPRELSPAEQALSARAPVLDELTIGERAPSRIIKSRKGEVERRAMKDVPAVEGRPDVPEQMNVGAPAEVGRTAADNAALVEPNTVLAREKQGLSMAPGKEAPPPVGEAKEVGTYDPRLAEIERLRAQTDNPAVRDALGKREAEVKKAMKAEDAARKRDADATALEDAIRKTEDPEIKAVLRAEADKLREKIPTPEVEEGMPATPKERVGKIPVGKTKEGDVEPVPAAPRPKLAEPEVTEIAPEVVEGGEPIPKGEATEVEPVPVGQADEMLPVGEAAEVLPVGESTEILPTGDAIDGPPPMDRVPMPPAPKPRMIERGRTTEPPLVSKATKAQNAPSEKTQGAGAVETIDGLKVRQVSTANGPRWEVQNPENVGTDKVLGNQLFKSREEAAREAPRMVKQHADRLAREAADEAESAARAAKTAENRGKSLTERRADATLDKPGRLIGGQGMSLREAVDKRIANGATVQTREGQRALVNPDGAYLLERQLSKTALDYAETQLKPQASEPAVKRVKGGPLEGSWLEVTLPDGTVKKMQRNNRPLANEIGGWSDVTEPGKQGGTWLGDTQAEALAELTRRHGRAVEAKVAKDHGLGTKDMERAKAVAAALEKDESAVVAATTKGHTPAAFDAEIERINRSESVKEPWNMTREEAAKDYPGDAYDKMINRASDLGDLTYAEADRKSRLKQGYGAGKKLWAQTRAEIEAEGKAQAKTAVKDRVEWNKLKGSDGYAQWRINSNAKAAQRNVESTKQYTKDLLGVHKERVEEALVAGHDVPPEVLNDYPDLKAKYASQPLQAAESSPRPEPRGQDAATRAEQPRPDGAATARADKPKADVSTRQGLVAALKKEGLNATDMDPGRRTGGRVLVVLDAIPYKVDAWAELKNGEWKYDMLGTEGRGDVKSISQREAVDAFKAKLEDLTAGAKPAAPKPAPQPMLAAPRVTAAPTKPAPKPLIARKNSEILADLNKQIDAEARYGAGGPERITLKSGGTTQTISNTAEGVSKWRAEAAKSYGFKDTKTPKPAPEKKSGVEGTKVIIPHDKRVVGSKDDMRMETKAWGGELSKRAPKAVVQDFVADGDFENASVLAEHYGVDVKAGMDAKQKRAYQDWQDGPQPIPEPPKKETLADMIAAAPPPKVEPVQATHPDPAANMAFDEWAKHQYATNEYKDGYLRRAGGDEKRAALMATVSGGSKEMPIKDLLAQAKQRYAQHLLELPRDATISLDVYDALPPMLQTEAARHFFDIDTRLTKRTQNEVAVRMKGQEAAEAPIRQRLVDVDAEIKRLDSRDGPDTQKVKDLRLKRAKLEQELYEMRRLY